MPAKEPSVAGMAEVELGSYFRPHAGGVMELGRHVMRAVGARLYRPHVGYEFPAAMLTEQRNALRPPEGYIVRQPPGPDDLELVAALLSQEPGFGLWTVERVQRELMAKLAHPKSATLILHGDEPVGVGFATDESTRGRKIAHGMYLYVAPAYRGRTKLAAFMVYSTLGYCLDAGCEQVLGFTDPTRLSALLLYLSNGVRPVYFSLSCHWHWRKIRRRLGPALKRAARLRTSGST